jgi:hypothetical protein
MDREQLPELVALEREARDRLFAGDWLVRLSIEPSFDDIVVLGILREGGRRRRGAVSLRRWRRAADSERLRSPVERMRHSRPLVATIEVADVELSPDAADAVLRAIGSDLVVPVFAGGAALVLDGTSYEVCIRRHPIACTLRWSNSHPAEWRPVMNWFGGTWRRLWAMAAGAGEQRFAWEDDPGLVGS